MITSVPGVRVGHWTDVEAATGCTVVLFPEGTVASGEVRGGAPATREFALLEPSCLVDRVDAVVLAGGSAFGLAAADGVMRFCEERGIGFPTSAGAVPIVVSMALFDLLRGDPSVRPGPAEGYAACVAAHDGEVDVGAVGAATGATVGNWRGPEGVRPGGLGSACEVDGDLRVAALVAVNAFGDADEGLESTPQPGWASAGPFANTTIGVVATNATMSKLDCLLAARAGHDGMARALRPAHTRFDGDALVAAAVGGVEAEVSVVQELAARAVEAAVRAALPGGGQR